MIDTELIKYFNDKPVKKVFLFGSSVVNEEIAHDIDILLELDFNSKITLFDMGTWAFELGNIFHKKIDLITTANINEHIRPFIEQQKKLIFTNPYYA